MRPSAARARTRSSRAASSSAPRAAVSATRSNQSARAPLCTSGRARASASKTSATRAITRDAMKPLGNGGSAEQEAELEKKIQAMTPRGQIAQGAQDSKDSEEGTALTVVRQLVSRPGLILLLALLALGWAVFYYPMALLVAGWTEDFKSVINPLVGLDTMRHMGATYFKAFLMYAAVEAASFFAGLVVAVVT